MAEAGKIAEVIEATSAGFTAQCYELYQSPPLGSLVRSGEIYGIVGNSATAGIEPGRRPIARGKNEKEEEDIYRSSPQLAKLLRSEFSVMVVGHRDGEKICQYLPPAPARIHSFVYLCGAGEVLEFSRCLDFLTLLVNAQLPVPTDEIIAAALRGMGRVREDAHDFLVAAGKELAVLLSGQYQVLRSILGRLR